MGRGRDEGANILCIGLTSIAAFISCFLLGFSFDTLEPRTMALMFDRNTRFLDCDTLYGAERNSEGRRFFTGLGRAFDIFRFPMTANNVVFSNERGADTEGVEARTVDGVIISMTMALQYQLPKNSQKLCGLYYSFGMSYESFFIDYTRAAARDALAQFTMFDLWQRRPQVGSAVTSAVNASLAPYVSMIGFQLLSLDTPNSIQNQIANTTVQYQKIGQALLQLNSTRVAQTTRFLQAQLAATSTVISAYAQANATQVASIAQAQAVNMTVVADALGYAAFKATFNMTNSEVLALAWVDSVLGSSADKVVSTVPPML